MAEIRTVRTEPEDVGEARAEVERNRERLTETLDAIEDRLVETKSALRDRVNVLRPVQEQVRSRPWVAVAAALGAGAALGAVMRGSSSGMSLIDEEERRRRREWRRRRSARMAGHGTQASDGLRIGETALPPQRRKRRKRRQEAGTMRMLRKQLLGTLTAAITRGLRQRIMSADGRRDDGGSRNAARSRVVTRGYEDSGLAAPGRAAHHEAGVH
jgi:ElaB/YqjD/DUF883 family membrane-anchored ribosome-binding protein